ncbi:MAG: adenylate/guanylate cyclase domain-containing protein [Bacteroidota bacterium]
MPQNRKTPIVLRFRQLFDESTRLLLFLSFILFYPFQSFGQDTNLTSQIKILLENSTYFYQENDFDKAAKQAQEAIVLAEQSQQKMLVATATYKKAQALLAMKKRKRAHRKEAKELLKKSLFLLATTNNMELRLAVLDQLEWIANQENDVASATLYAKQKQELKKLAETKEIAEELEERTEELSEKTEELEEKTENLSVRVETLNDQKKALTEQVATLNEEQLQAQLVIALQKNEVDSFKFERQLDSLILAQNDFIVKEQASQLKLSQNELQLQQAQRNFFLALAGIVAIIAIGVFLRYTQSKKLNAVLKAKNEIIEQERKKSEQLLLNILPVVVANELKIHGVAKARKYNHATVFFSDFINFSHIAKSLSPEELVNLLDHYFKIFDKIIEKYGLEKIKTIGDAYMCVGGLPDRHPTHPQSVIQAGLEIQALLAKQKKTNEQAGKPYFEARIGIHTGPLVAGVVGSKKFAFDVWGDTVNVAARLEAKGASGKVNISASTYKIVKDDFKCTARGSIPVKNRGEIEMYFVEAFD